MLYMVIQVHKQYKTVMHTLCIGYVILKHSITIQEMKIVI